jgi:hypothetical protein
MTGLDMLLQRKRTADRMVWAGTVLMGIDLVLGLIYPKPAVYLFLFTPPFILIGIGSLVYYWTIRCPQRSRRLGRIMVRVPWVGRPEVDFKFCLVCGLDFARPLNTDEWGSKKGTGGDVE